MFALQSATPFTLDFSDLEKEAEYCDARTGPEQITVPINESSLNLLTIQRLLFYINLVNC